MNATYLCLLICILGFASPAQASFITIETGFRVTETGNGPVFSVSTKNRGDEPAYKLQLEVTALAQRYTGSRVQKLDVDQIIETEFRVGEIFEQPGHYPIVIRTHYKDANGYPFSALATGFYDVGEAALSKVLLRASPVTIPANGKGRLETVVRNNDSKTREVSLRLYLPDELVAVQDTAALNMPPNSAEIVVFEIENFSALANSGYAVILVAGYEAEGTYFGSATSTRVRVSEPEMMVNYTGLIPWLFRGSEPWPTAADEQPVFHRPGIAWAASMLAVLGILLLFPRLRSLVAGGIKGLAMPENFASLLVLLAVEAFIILHLSPASLLTSTITTGGDTASHFYTLFYLVNELLPNGQISGWTPGNYAGFPILQFYFPLVFLFMAFLDGILSLEVAFKLGSILGTLLLPLGAYGMLRLVRIPFPAPAIAAVLTLPFLFNADNSMWGGNILSSLAGEFSYGLSLAISLVALGSLYRGAVENRNVVLNALLIFLVGFSHGYTLLFVEAMSVYLLITPYGFFARLLYLAKVYLLAFCLLAFWIVPLLVFSSYTTSYDTAWMIGTAETLVPALLLPVLAAGLLGSVALLGWGVMQYRAIGPRVLHPLGYLWFGLFMCVVFFVAAPKIGVVDIRYVPIAYLLLGLMAAMSAGWLGWYYRKWKLDWLLLAVVSIASFVWTGTQPGPAADWARWNYGGFEARSSWGTFEAINQALQGSFDEPRVVYEHSPDHNTFGSTRAFESLPLFSGRATLEGLYMQASISAPFVFYIQSEISKAKSVPFPQYTYSSMDFDRARKHLQLFNVRDLLIRSTRAKQAIRTASGYRLQQTIGDYELWQLESGDGRYVVALRNEPVLLLTDTWKRDAFQWFTNPDLLDAILVFERPGYVIQDSPFKVVARETSDIRAVPLSAGNCMIEERIGNEAIDITTDCIGRPLLIKMTYHPNWHVSGAERIYRASPSFMLIYPEQRHVRLSYGPGKWNRAGQSLTLFALLVLLLNVPVGATATTLWQRLPVRSEFGSSLLAAIRLDPPHSVRWRILTLAVVAGLLLVGLGAWQVYQSDVHRTFNKSVRLKDQQQYEKARQGFRYAMDELPSSNLAQDSAYYVAMTYYLEKDCDRALPSFNTLIRRHPKGNWLIEAKYHIGLCLFMQGEELKGVQQMQLLRKQHPDTRWAEYAGERLREHHIE